MNSWGLHLDKDPLSEMEGRLAALELVLALVLGVAGRTAHNAAWPLLSDVALQKAIQELRKSLGGNGAMEAETSLRLLFERSMRDFQIESVVPDAPLLGESARHH